MMEVRVLGGCLLLLHSVCSQASINRRVYAWVGTDVVLDCRSQIGDSITQVTWQRTENGQDVNFLVNIMHEINKLTPFAKERVDFLGRESTDGSIKIRNVILADEGVYTCIFTVDRSGATKYPITLIVQVKPHLRLEPSPDPVLLKPPYETIATCVAGAAKPSVTISWMTKGLDYKSSENVLAHNNGTSTTLSQLRMIPRPEIHGHNVTCVISQHNGTFDENTEQSLNIQNVQYPPDSVQVMLRILGDGTFQFTCVEDSNPPATNFTWTRKDGFGSDLSVELGSGKTVSGQQLPSGLYTCEATNLLGRSSGSLYFYIVPGSSVCLHTCLWLGLFLLLIYAIGIFIILRNQKLLVHRKGDQPQDSSSILACCDRRKAEELRGEAYRSGYAQRLPKTSESKEEEMGDLTETPH